MRSRKLAGAAEPGDFGAADSGLGAVGGFGRAGTGFEGRMVGRCDIVLMFDERRLSVRGGC